MHSKMASNSSNNLDSTMGANRERLRIRTTVKAYVTRPPFNEWMISISKSLETIKKNGKF